jgi:predicted cupin superfamily sugar epimerase
MWQGTMLEDGGSFGYALLGTTMTPGFRRDQFRMATPADLEAFSPTVVSRLTPFLSPDMA